MMKTYLGLGLCMNRIGLALLLLRKGSMGRAVRLVA